jgi:hypothetical protein
MVAQTVKTNEKERKTDWGSKNLPHASQLIDKETTG